MFSVTGIASGLDTDSMLRQLLQVERLPIQRLERHQASLRKQDDAWGEVTKRLSSLRTAIGNLSKTSLAEMWKASSSDEAVATASVTGAASAGSMSFQVESLATAKSSHSQAGVAAVDAAVGVGEMTVQVGDVSTTITTTATTTLSELATQIDDIAGVRASVVKAGEEDFRLVLTAEKTGTANAYTATVATGLANLGAFAETAAKDATLNLGGLTVTRSTNTITDLVEGVSIALKDTGSVTVDTSQDLDGAVGAVKKLVDEVNDTLDKLKTLGSYNAESNTGGPLQGDSTARRLVDTLRRGVMDIVGGVAGGYTTAGSVGISMNRDGGFTLDETKLKAALEADPSAVDRLFTRGATSSLAGVSYTTSATTTQAGTYDDFTVVKAAQVASLTGASVVTDPPPAKYTITGADGRVITVTISDVASVAAAVAQINDQVAAAENAPAVQARVENDGTGDRLVLEETRDGSAHGFTVASDPAFTDAYGLEAGVYTAGQDAEISVAGATWTGTGSSIRITDGPLDGLQLSVGPDAELGTGKLDVGEGVVGRLDRLLAGYEGTNGFVDRARKSLDGRIDLYQDRIDDFELRIASRETTLRRQFTAMETALAQLQSQGNWLAGQLGGLSQPPA